VSLEPQQLDGQHFDVDVVVLVGAPRPLHERRRRASTGRPRARHSDAHTTLLLRATFSTTKLNAMAHRCVREKAPGKGERSRENAYIAPRAATAAAAALHVTDRSGE